MDDRLESEVRNALVHMISDGFNRSMLALEKHGAVKRKRKMRKHYRGRGSKYYDLVTAQIEYTADLSARSIVTMLKKHSIEAGHD